MQRREFAALFAAAGFSGLSRAQAAAPVEGQQYKRLPQALMRTRKCLERSSLLPRHALRLWAS